ncbi:vacuolar protein 8 isoform X1 [Iris pallida]|uniref:Vacuolar protein 8 isoform X1 n=1 Tax=Iris pallida TaxID=29817 RepID=A0AAX6GF80_IRIPA|nr:vacuolar protein 8 isoform X1 [Iris pallida]
MKEMKEEEGEAPTSLSALREASRLVNSLVASSYAVRSFPVKWHSIRDKLEKLDSSLTSAGTDAGHGVSSELGELLDSVTATVSDARSLADRCCDECYSGGKLQLRSDLDVVISRLGLHMRRLDEIYASGTLSHSRAIILSRPGATASRDHMRLYVKDIFARMRIGGSELRAQALAALNQVLSEDEKYVRIVACEMADGVSLLVSLLESGDPGIQEEASGAVAVISGFESYRGALATAGAVGPLIRVLETGNGPAKERAGQALKRMTANCDNSWSVSAQGGVCTLLKICGGGGGSSSKELIASALSVLRNISRVGEIKRFMVEEGAIAALAKLLWSKEEAIQIQAVDFLATLASEDESVKQRAVREGGVVESLLHILQPSSHCSSKAREAALRAIDTFCFASAGSVSDLIGSGFLDLLLFFVRNGEASVRGSALRSVSRLCLVSEEAKKAMGDLGFMQELVSLLEAGCFEAREAAAEALCGLVSAHRNRRKFVQDEHSVSRILRLLDPEEEKPVAAKKLLLSALLVLTESHSGRRRIVASGYVKNLEKLAEKDVTDAKKIVKKLSGSRLRNMLNGIWSS